MTDAVRSRGAVATIMAISACDGESSGGNNQDSTQGSRARFAMMGDFLYTISGDSLQLFDIKNPASPNPWARVRVEWDIETLFPYNTHLLIGSQSGVHIFDNTDPANPAYVTEFTHARSCDPVVAESNIAYVTLRSNDNCTGAIGQINQLDIIDLSDITAPALIKSYAMQAPSGLAIDGGTLFICDSIAGLKVFDASNPAALTVLDIQTDINCYDVIASGGRLYVSEADQLLQFDYTRFPMTLVSKLATRADP